MQCGIGAQCLINLSLPHCNSIPPWRVWEQLHTCWHRALRLDLEPRQCFSCCRDHRCGRSHTDAIGRPDSASQPSIGAPQTNVAFNLLRSTCLLPPLCSGCLLALTMEGKSEFWYTADLILLPRQRSSKATPSHFLSRSEPWEPRRSLDPLWVGLLSPGSAVTPILSKSKARFGVGWLERDEGDLDLRRERRGGRGGGGGGGGGGGAAEGRSGLEEVVLLPGILKPPPPFSLPLHLSLSLPEEEEAALQRQATQARDGGDTRNDKALTITAKKKKKNPHAGTLRENTK